MKINSLRVSKLRNEEHAQFQNEFKDLVEQFTAVSLNIEEAFAAYLPLYANEQTALNIVLKSTLTNAIADADHQRDNIFRGMADAVIASLHHYSSNVVEAAEKVQVVFKHYGNVAEKSYNEETAAIGKLLSELQNNYADQVNLLGIDGWMNELQSKNNAFESLMDERYSEEAGKTPLRMSTVRTQVDAAYRTVVERIDALIIVNGESAYTSFVNELNERIDKFNNLIAQREGRSKADIK